MMGDRIISEQSPEAEPFNQNQDHDLGAGAKKAIALKYDAGRAPYLSAKGEDELAREIMEIAAACSVPMFQQSDLAEVLYQLDLNEEIPEVLYVAVAEVISFAYMLAGKTPWDET